MSTFEDAVRELCDLPTADAVAERLRKDGIKGMRGAQFDCPVALWLSKQCGEHIRVTDRLYTAISKQGGTRMYPIACASVDELRVVDLSGAVTKFIREFDSRIAYQDLKMED